MEKVEITIDAYNKNANKYADKFMDFDDYKKIVIEFADDISDNDKILDLACGPGNIMYYINSTGKNVKFVGVDLSESFINIAKNNIKNAKFYCQDLRKFDIEEKDFDIMMMSFCIVHLSNEEAIELIKKASSLLKNGGKFYISFMEGKKPGYETTSFSNDPIYFNYYRSDNIIEILKNTGITPYKVTKQDYKEDDGSITSDIFIFGKK